MLSAVVAVSLVLLEFVGVLLYKFVKSDEEAEKISERSNIDGSLLDPFDLDGHISALFVLQLCGTV